MQTISFLLCRLQESGLGSQDILSEKLWKLKKNMLESFLHQGKKATYVFLSSVSGNLEPKHGLHDYDHWEARHCDSL